VSCIVLVSARGRRGEDVLVKAQVRVACISEGRAQPIPKALRILLKTDQI
jgi:acyl-CoA thioester hydrolase